MPQVASQAPEVGGPPARSLERLRTGAARRDLETTNDPLGVITEGCGFGTAETLSRMFNRRLNVSPDAYRRRFGVVTDKAGRIDRLPRKADSRRFAIPVPIVRKETNGAR